MVGVGEMAVSGWAKTADEKGFDILRPQNRSGRPNKLTDEQFEEIDAALQSDPKDFGYNNCGIILQYNSLLPLLLTSSIYLLILTNSTASKSKL